MQKIILQRESVRFHGTSIPTWRFLGENPSKVALSIPVSGWKNTLQILSALQSSEIRRLCQKHASALRERPNT